MNRARKYFNKPTRGYESKIENKRARDLWLLQRAGEISELKEQVTFDFDTLVYASGRKIRYIADFTYMSKGKYIVEDVKSSFTAKLPVYKIKKALMKYFHGIDIYET